MALIENLEHEGWEKFFRDSFRYALEVLKNDRFRPVGSSVDDLKSWLTAGGVARVRTHLNKQMEIRRFPSSRKSAVNEVGAREPRYASGLDGRWYCPYYKAGAVRDLRPARTGLPRYS